MRIKCYCNLYVSEGIRHKKVQVLEALMRQEPTVPVFLLTMAEGDHNQLEFFSSVFLKQPYYKEKEIFIVGLAESYLAAEDLVEQITCEVLSQTGALNIREFILTRQKSFEES